MAELNYPRRALLQAMLGASVAGVNTPALANAEGDKFDMSARVTEIERRSGGRLGVFVLDSTSGRSFSHNADRRFGMCSSFKLMLAAIVLREADAGRLNLEQTIPIAQSDMVYHAPVTQAQVGKRMSIRDLAAAAQITSDNVATNLLLKEIGGPSGFTTMLRGLGDEVTRLDRFEPQMNMVAVGDERDTTSPRAMANVVARIMTSDRLSPSSLALLVDWLVTTKTGLRRIRAGLPMDWRAGDKTGTGIWKGMPNRHNDIAVIWPASAEAAPPRKPIIAAVYFEAPGFFENTRPQDDAVLAQVGGLLARWSGLQARAGTV